MIDMYGLSTGATIDGSLKSFTLLFKLEGIPFSNHFRREPEAARLLRLEPAMRSKRFRLKLQVDSMKALI